MWWHQSSMLAIKSLNFLRYGLNPLCCEYRVHNYESKLKTGVET